MSENMHGRAEQLILQSQVENVTAADLKWLEAHLASCPACARRAAAMDHAIQSIRSVSVRVNPALVEMTRLRVRRRAQELDRRRLPGMWLWVVSAISWAWIAASASYLWRGFGWMAHRVGIPSPLWQMGFAMWWAVPALVLAAVLSMQSLQDESLMQE
jgi:anti-sigma factor RsiW